MALIGCACFCLQAGPARAEKRLALSVGVDAYDNLPADAQLKKAVNDARAVGAAFRDLGFEVTVEENVPKLAFTRAWTQFVNRLQPGDTAALFFAGHGAEIGGLNYLWPRDAPKVVRGEEKVLAAASIRFNELMDDLQDKKVRVALFIIDACRENPFRDSRGRSYVGGTRGLVPVEPAKGIFVMYSAGVREQALDALSGADMAANSPYTRTLLPLLTTPGLSLQEIARRVRIRVAALALQAKPPHEQTPAYYDNLLGDFELKPGAPPAEPKQVVVPQPQMSEAPSLRGVWGEHSEACRDFRDQVAPTWASGRYFRLSDAFFDQCRIASVRPAGVEFRYELVCGIEGIKGHDTKKTTIASLDRDGRLLVKSRNEFDVHFDTLQK
jgi:uncharacterized caspase-like protein